MQYGEFWEPATYYAEPINPSYRPYESLAAYAITEELPRHAPWRAWEHEPRPLRYEDSLMTPLTWELARRDIEPLELPGDPLGNSGAHSLNCVRPLAAISALDDRLVDRAAGPTAGIESGALFPDVIEPGSGRREPGPAPSQASDQIASARLEERLDHHEQPELPW